MSHNDDAQRNADWFSDRLGIPTASRFNDLMTQPKTKADKEAGNLSDTSFSYAVDLVSQRITGESPFFESRATDWGTEKEPLAVKAYQEFTGNNVIECGFFKHPALNCGASPDGLVGLVGGIEIKCPYVSLNHIKAILRDEVPRQYVAQIQGQMWVLGLEWVDFVSFDPRMPERSQIFVKRVIRDDEYIKTLEANVINFLSKVDEYEAFLNGDKVLKQSA